MLPLWTPSPISLGAVGYFSRPSGAFMTLFNAFNPVRTSVGVVHSMPSVKGYGEVQMGSQRMERRSIAQKSLDVLSGLLTFKLTGDGQVSCVFFLSLCRLLRR